ncbi:unnamed protein product [Bursaphelenchus xylophilus]|uniref:(pine wood nematode) hypothetical protein n=1 Tax=Bursaphelenchus xylophilus TaxID=6326 RepID=A0A1I7SSS0_BURXY|nr:unnamed protein product [Bursaphelenchus xylophilus]CAG9108903.1 unnamed protein product [Bursaphelenchus xylophilus]
MPYRIFRRILNDERVIQQMADSWPMRRAAKLAVTSTFQLRHKIESSGLMDGLLARTSNFRRLFQEEYKKRLEQRK